MYTVDGQAVVYESDVEPDWHRQGSQEWILASTREWMWGRLQGRRPLKNEEVENGD